MKYTLYIMPVLMLTGFSAAVVGHNGSGGDVSITGSSASSSTAVGPNGTEFTAEVSMNNRSSRILNETLENIEFSGVKKASVSLVGKIQAPTPCHTIDHRVSERDEDYYVMSIRTVQKAQKGQFCIQQLVMIEYSGKFETNEPFRLRVKHNGEEIRTLKHPDFKEESETGQQEPENERRGFLGRISKWFSSLF